MMSIDLLLRSEITRRY